MTSLVHEGRIIRKKKIRDWIVISVKGENEECSKDWTLPRYKYDFLFLGSVVQVTSADPNGKDDVVQDVQLIKVAPDPLAVKTAIGSILAGRLTDASALCLRIEELEELQNSAAANYNFDNVLIKWQSRILKRTQGREERTTPRKRKPHTSRSHLAILCYLENAGSTPGNDWKLVQPVESRSSVAAHIVENSSRSSFNGNSGISSFPLNLPVGLDGQTGRVDYIVDKKGPQIQWIVSRLRTLFLAEKQYCHVVDVGGGRGDLATRIAKEFSFVHVTVVDKNESSLQAGKDYANSLGVADRMSFVPDDFADFRKYNSKVDLVVALHACGDLSDLAVQFAQDQGCDFVVCPCCYTKRYIDNFTPAWCQVIGEEQSTTLGRLAETDFQPDISSRARLVVNSLRVHCISSEYLVSLEEYSKSTSKRNLVLVGTTTRGIAQL